MKKILFSVLALGALALSSCDMNETQPGTIPDNKAIQTAEDCLSFRNGLYASLRALMAGDYITRTELETDYYVGIVGNGNRGMSFNTATVTSSLTDVTEPYDGSYSVMKNVNFLLEMANNLLESGNLSEAEQADVKRYIAETRFMRAYIYYYLFDHYCQAYSTDKADQEGLGLSLVTIYAPTGDTSKYPGRSTMNQVKSLVDEDLAAAFSGLQEYEKVNPEYCVPNASYLSSFAVAALQARWALLTKDYKAAIEKAEYVTNSGKFPLAKGDDYKRMWTADQGTELIFVPFVDASESAYVGSFNDAWNYYANFPDRVDYIPTNATINLYDMDNDIRFESFFEGWSINVSGTAYDAFIMQKFPGNDALISGTNEYKNKPKPFRTSELYLIIAEARASDGAMKNEGEANIALNKIKEARFTGKKFEEETYTGVALVNEIRKERAKELIGEGFRLSDLRRWGLGYERDGSYPLAPETENAIIFSTTQVAFSPNDFRYVWPIPASEMEINPQLKGQQNPGY